MNKLTTSFYTFALFCLIAYVLMAGKAFLIPLMIAVVIWYLIVSIAHSISELGGNKFTIPTPLALIFAILLCFTILYLAFSLVTSNISSVVAAAPTYQAKLMRLIHQGFAFLKIPELPSMNEIFSKYDIVSTFSTLAQTITDIASSTGIILIYVLFLLLDYSTFDKKLAAFMKDTNQLNNTRKMLHEISMKIQRYLKLKTTLSLITALSSYLVLFLVGVDFAAFWAFLIFLLNFIPTIGSILATLFPCFIALIQFDAWTPFLIVVSGLIAIQFVIGNLIEPRLMGKSFNLSGLVIILSLSLWGQIWGIVGMFLSVPIMVIATIILASFPATRPIAILLSADGKVLSANK